MNTIVRPNQYKYLPFLSMLYITIGILCPTLLASKLISSSVGIISATSIPGPLWFIIGGVIAEIYGLRTAVKLFFAEMLCELFFISLCIFTINLKLSPIYYQSYYNFFFNYALDQQVFSFVATVAAWNINIYFLTKWKILVKGKYFWLRSLGSSFIGECIFSAIIIPCWIWHGAPSYKTALQLFAWTCALRISFTTIWSVPGTYIVKILRVLEDTKCDHSRLNPNPFKKISTSII